MTLVERIKHRRRNPTDALLEQSAHELVWLESMVDRRNRMIRELLNTASKGIPAEMYTRAERLIEDEEI